MNPRLWLDVQPASSTGAHLFLKAVRLSESEGGCGPGAAEAATAAFRRAFFADGRDIARRDVQRDIGRECGVDLTRVEALMDDGRAYAALASDYQDAEAMSVQGSPTFVLNEGRQKLYGNVGDRIIEANVQELPRAPHEGQASWC